MTIQKNKYLESFDRQDNIVYVPGEFFRDTDTLLDDLLIVESQISCEIHSHNKNQTLLDTWNKRHTKIMDELCRRGFFGDLEDLI